MKIKVWISFTTLLILLMAACQDDTRPVDTTLTIGTGQMPAVVTTDDQHIHLVYGRGDSILYVNSDDAGMTFSVPSLIAVLPDLVSSHTRGPQIAVSSGTVTVTACVESGDIYSFSKGPDNRWSDKLRINDVDTIAKEALMALSGDGNLLFAVWLDLRNKHNQIYGSSSSDGGRTWAANKMIYASKDSTVCECCKPSVLVNGKSVSVMFRNWIDGNRDMYLIQSGNGGESFGEAEKLGRGSWKLDGCPMDGGGLTLSNNKIQSVWRREDKIYLAEPGKTEIEIGKGKSSKVTNLKGHNVYSWIENGDLIFSMPGNQRTVIGKGGSQVIEALNNNSLICAWEDNKTIKVKIVSLHEL
jgi:hypothetical protein